MMIRIFKYALFLLAGLLIIIFSYYGIEIYRSRIYTDKVVLKDLRHGQWRSPQKAPIKFDIHARDLTDNQRRILLKVQDPNFDGHRGLDLSTPGAGLTTITQAIVKKLYFEEFKPGIAKIRQSLIARFVVNHMISKEDQLTLFINTMYFGKVNDTGVVGIQSAASTYHQKPIGRLTEDQYISLVAMLVMPGTFHLLDHPEWNQQRVLRIKALMDGRYQPKGLMDQFYGKLPPEAIAAGLPSFSYFPDLYEK